MLRFSRASILASAIFASLLVAECAPSVQADETNLVIGHGVVCDTAEEVKAVIAPAGDDIVSNLEAYREQCADDGFDAINFEFCGLYSRRVAQPGTNLPKESLASQSNWNPESS